MLQHSLSQSICARFSNNLYQTWGIVHLSLIPCKLVNMYMQADQLHYTVCIYYIGGGIGGAGGASAPHFSVKRLWISLIHIHLY